MVPQCGDYLVEGQDDVPELLSVPHVPLLLLCLDLLEPGQYRRHRLLGVVVCFHDGGEGLLESRFPGPVWVFQIVQCGCVLELGVYFERGGVYRQWNTAVERPPRGFVGRNGMGVIVLAWQWRFGHLQFSAAADEAAFRGCRVFGGLAVGGQNDRGGLPRPRRYDGGLLTGGKGLLPPRSE
ncbi:hypothetical protein NDU88_001882 [Pleurodeles waltl]|uniref:Uncharacterized protein n=1 Tax=Pleurodeles waltl TaxID=8319 RepID=A0AAV7TJK8_PLEWA|nr:hypothetical protein NDU88_001882 [Pleurodeles waltl]